MCERHRDGLRLLCRDDGVATDRTWSVHDRRYLAVDPGGLDPSAEAGKGLAMVDALATGWGGNGRPSHREVWCFLAYDFEDSIWPLLHR